MAVDREQVFDLIRFLLVDGTKVMDEVFRPDSCIARTRIGINFLHDHDVAARPIPVSVAAWSPKGWELAQQDVPMTEWPGDAWSVAVEATGKVTRFEEQPDGRVLDRFDGHLVIHVPTVRGLVDLSLQQMSRPQKGLPLVPTAFELDDEWDTSGRAMFRHPQTAVVIAYTRADHIPPQTWREAGDWWDRRGLARWLRPRLNAAYEQTRKVTA